MAAVQKTSLLREGKSKQVFLTDDPGLVWIHFKDDATAFNGVKKASVRDKGEVNARISAFLMERMAAAGIATHQVHIESPVDHICHATEVIPVEVVVRNFAAGSICKRLGLEEGVRLSRPLVEYFYKSDELNDPLITVEHIDMFGWAQQWELAYMRHAALVVNRELQAFWGELGVDIVDFKVEFGRMADGRVLLIDEISPDGSRLWERGTMRKLDKDVFRRDLGDLGDTYRELFTRVFGHELRA